MPGKNPLGKGLSALISEGTNVNGNHSYLPNLAIDKIKPNPHQPRIDISAESLSSLSDSIKLHGVIEPLIVTQKGRDSFELIAGERRLKAASIAGLKEIPAVVKETTPQQMLEMALVENIQRADLNPLEEAVAFNELVNEYKVSPGEISKTIGLSRPAILNKIRLLNLPQEIKKGLLEDKISEGHARALLGIKSQEQMIRAYEKTVKESLSVRAVEELVRRINAGEGPVGVANARTLDNKTLKFETELRKALNLKVRIQKSREGGKIIIPFSNKIEFNKTYKLLTSGE